MKKTIVMTIIFVMVLLSFANIVKAETATVSISGKNEVKVNEEVQVKISINSAEKVIGSHFVVNYDADKLSYVKSGATAANGKTAGVVDLETINTDGIEDCVITFKVKENATGKAKVTISEVELTAGATEENTIEATGANKTLEMTIAEEAKIDDNTEKTQDPTAGSSTETPDTTKPTTTDTKNDDTTKPATTDSKKDDTTAPSKYPKTGFDVAPMLIAGLTVSLVVVVKKLRKISK